MAWGTGKTVMSLSLAFRFLAGRYHATPFGHHVNEGLIEWPPSPWRLLRALISVGYTSGHWDGDGPPTAARNLVEKLSNELPSYHLPRAIGTHNRHYMPIGALEGETKIEKTTLVFDAWARVGDGEMTVNWGEVRLAPDEAAMLDALAQRLNYLGRSESWVACRVVAASEATREINSFPERPGEIPGRGWEQVSLLAPVSAPRFAVWRDERLAEAIAKLQPPEGRKPSATTRRKRDKAIAPYPDDLLDCLRKNTDWWRSHGWSQPPGSRRVFYWRRADAIAIAVPRAKRAASNTRRAGAMLLSMTNASRNDHALPSVTRTLAQADLLHRALVKKAAGSGVPLPELTGRDEAGRPLRGPHEHAHINPLDLDGDGHLDHILIWARMGFGPKAQAAIRSVRSTYAKGIGDPLRLAVAAAGDLDDFSRLPEKWGDAIAAITGKDSVWRSATPLVLPRGMKPRGKRTLEGQIRTALCARGFPNPVSVRWIAPTSERKGTSESPSGSDARRSRFRHFALSRGKGKVPPFLCGFDVELEFDAPVCGPVALGYGSHFGLGLFERTLG